MNTWGYLTLIAALLLLTAYMLYARFVARSREKSLHHAPAEAVTVEFESRAEPLIAEESPFEVMPMDLKALSGEPVAEVKDENEEKEKDTYFDDLQEAAAGLAMLMRSSPAQDRSEPVVFAPETEEVTEEPESVEVSQEEATEEELVSTIEDSNEVVKRRSDADPEKVSDDAAISEAIDQVEAILEVPPVFAGEHEDLTVEAGSAVSGEASLEVLLGEEVSEQFSRLDTGLDELEALVVDIEEQLMRFDEFISSSPEAVVEEAA